MKLSDVCELIVDCPHTTAKDEGVGYPLIRTPNIGKGRLILSNVHRVSYATYCKRNERAIPQKNDLILAREAPVGNVAIIKEGQKVCLGQRTVLIRPDKSIADPDYLVHYLLSPQVQHVLLSASNGATVSHLNMSDIRGLEISLPELPIQRRIGCILSDLEDKIENNNRINDNLLRQTEAIYKAWFCDRSDENGSNLWPNTTVGDITSLVVRGITPKYNDDTDQIVINQKCIRNHMVDLSQARRHLPKAITEKWLVQGDLLINSTGEGTLGRVAQIWFAPNNLTVDSHVTIVRPKSAMLRNYIGLWGLTHEAEIEALHTGSTGQTELPRERVKAMELPLPDDSTLSRFNELITPMTQIIVENQQESIRLTELRETLLPRLMCSELDVSALDI